ncbi:hypothetical protein Lfu02_32170 [Longispora fulva]|uniref:Uncharacterized protein n=1 Tax=Longispora fulva TaxID=619741 RepID=A0A8J7GW60_9ACTN|nr:hypothetical protein [Longispora fulva]MBG6139348.1 hypothetical protein [Longispora fulva]GIG58845.1 hypothetical protein Lfu02_32170 [Longispora fulva]
MIPNESPDWIGSYQAIDVDITSLHDFAEVVRRDLEENFKQAWNTDIRPYFEQGAQMGNSCYIRDLLKVRAYYERCLTKIDQSMANFHRGTAAMAAAADLVARRYQGGDVFSAELQDQVRRDIDTALPPPGPAPVSPSPVSPPGPGAVS